MSPSEEPTLEIDRRVHSVSDFRRIGTVKYVGSVHGYSGIWIGVDWDNGDGKHDGTVNGVRYFQARGEKTGSLVRPHTINKGVSFLEALAYRYTGETTKEEEDEMYVLSLTKNRVAIQLLGKDKAQEKFSRLGELRHVSLAYLGVSSCGPPHAIHGVIPNLKELDLTGNLLSQWEDVNSICEELPALEVLDLTCNRMSHNVCEMHSLRKIRVLVLNNCGITWKQVDVLKQSLPAIEELHLMSNKLTTIETSPSLSACSCVEGFNFLRVLNLENNLIDKWDEILKLAQLSSLEQLDLSNNNLRSISYPAYHHGSEYGCKLQENYIKPFNNLHCLLLGGNKIKDLGSVDSLNNFPNLRDIRLSGNPISDPGKGGVQRFVLIASLAKITMLNGSEVTPNERKEAEIRYVRLVMASMQLDKQEEIRQMHPRFFALRKFHGLEDERRSSATVGPQKMASGLIPITLKCIGASMGEKLPLMKKLPATTTIGKLKVLCVSFFKLKYVKPKLLLQEEGRLTHLLLDNDMDSLADLRIGSSGCTLLVDEN